MTLHLAYCYARGTFQGLRQGDGSFIFMPWPQLINKDGSLTEDGKFVEATAREAFQGCKRKKVALLPALWAALVTGRWFIVGFRQGVAYHESQDPEAEDSIGSYIDAGYFPAGINIPSKYQAAVCVGFSKAIGVPVRLEGGPGRQRFEIGLRLFSL